MYLTIALLSSPFNVYTYLAADEFPDSFWQKGLRLCIPLGRGDSLRTGILLETAETADLPKTVSVKKIVWPLEDRPILSAELIELMKEMSKRQGESIGRMAAGFLPIGLRNLSVVLNILEETHSRSLTISEIAHAAPEFRKRVAQQMLEGRAKLLPRKRDAAAEERYMLQCDPPWPVRPHAKLQIQILDYLYEHGAKNKKQLINALGQGAAQALRSLCTSGCLELGRDNEEDTALSDNAGLLPPTERPFALNSEQKCAVDHLRQAVTAHTFSARLLYGVTGSGKTAVYLEIALLCLRMQRSVFLLVPEVALALKILQDTKTLYPDIPVVLYHGYQSQRSRESLWRRTETDQAIFVIGTRSALFLPAPNLGCIILDEEHDSSFKQDDGLIYHAKEIAWFRAKYNNALLLLGSATPDIRTFYAAHTGSLAIDPLRHRISGNTLPPIELVDLRERSSLSESVSLLAKKSLTLLEETIHRGEQAVILLNRRGYAPHMYCLACGKTERCPDCEIGLTYHKARGKLVCHFCGYTKDFPSPCQSCGAASFLPLGEGTERVAEELSSYLGQNVLRLDRDSTRRTGQMEAILHAFADQEAKVLVGTQMLSKGHHFPQVTLVIAANADMGLSIPDYRATERTFQLLLQSAGRAGRGKKPGRVLLQTRDCEHYCWPFVLAYDYENFYEAEIARRKKHRYPPFSNLALIRLSYPRDEQNAPTETTRLTQAFRHEAAQRGVVFLGPAPSPHAMLCGRKRFQCLLKAADWGSIREVFAAGLRASPSKTVRVSLDLDPVNML